MCFFIANNKSYTNINRLKIIFIAFFKNLFNSIIKIKNHEFKICIGIRFDTCTLVLLYCICVTPTKFNLLILVLGPMGLLCYTESKLFL